MQKVRNPDAKEGGKWALKVLLGIGNANFVAASLVWIITHYLRHIEGGLYTTAATVLVPITMGTVASYFWRDLEPSTGEVWLWSLYSTFIALGLGFLLFREGGVCLVMAFPLLYLCVVGGAFIGRYVFRAKPGPLNASLVPVLLILMAVDSRIDRTYQSSVTTTYKVNAPASAIYPYIVAFPRISQPSRFWLCYLGLPYPVEATVSGRNAGADRACKFSGNIVIREKVTALVPGRQIDFDIVETPRYPEIADHATLERGRIEIVDKGDGTSTLVGTSWYSLRVFPGCYFDLWAAYLIHQVHGRVFAHIADLAGRDAVLAKRNLSPVIGTR